MRSCALVLAAGCAAAPMASPRAPDGGPPSTEAPARPPALHGVPHVTPFRQVALTPDGRAALTRDDRGAVRLWTALDGSAAPVVVRLREVRALSLATAPGGFSVGTIDGSGTARLLRVAASGTVAELAALPPFPPAEAVEALAGGRFVVLGTDKRLTAYDASGHAIGVLERGDFRATRLLRAGDGALVFDPGSDEVTRVTIVDSRLEARSVRASVAVAATAAVSDDGRTFATFTRDHGPARVIRLDLEAGTESSVELPLVAPRLAFRGTSILVYENGRSFRVEPSGAAYPLPESPLERQPFATAAGVRATGVGTWLYVENEGGGMYMGHERLRGASAALSPDGKRLVWLADGEIEVGDAVVSEAHFAAFVSSARMAVASRTGAIRLVDAATGAVRAEGDVGGPIRELDAASALGVVRVVTERRQTLVYLARDDRLQGPYVVADGSVRSGLLAAATPDEPVLWTVDSSRRVRRYTLRELEMGLSRSAFQDRASTGTVENVEAAMDRAGNAFVAAGAGGKYTITRAGGSKATLPWSPRLLTASPRGDVVVATGATGTLAYRGDTLAEAWSLPGAGASVTFSEDGSRLAVSTAGGALVVDAATGAVVDKMCGTVFVARRTPPPETGSNGVASVCEAP